MVEVGETAPEFTADGSDGTTIRSFTLSEYLAETPALLAFYVYDFSPVCTDQVYEIDDLEFLTVTDEVAVFGISTDGPYSHREFAAANDLSYPLLTDGDKEIYAEYGMLRETADGTCEPRRGIVVVDTDRTVRYRWLADNNWADWDVTPLENAYETINRLALGRE